MQVTGRSSTKLFQIMLHGFDTYDVLVIFLLENEAPSYLFVLGFAYDLFVGPGGTIARGQILESHDT
jgi:hypothetical protein